MAPATSEFLEIDLENTENQTMGCLE